MLITSHIHTPVAANLPALNLRLIEATEDPEEKLEIAEASIEALKEVPRYEEVAQFTQKTLTGISGAARRQAMISGALAAMVACPSMICVGHALIGHAPRKEQAQVASLVLTEIENGSTAPELTVARRLLEDSALTGPERARIVQSAINSTGQAASLLDATSDMLSVPFENNAHQRRAADVAIDALLPIVPAYARSILELASDLLATSPRSDLSVTQELFWAAEKEPGSDLTSSLYSASLKARGEESREAVLKQGLQFLRTWSEVPAMPEAVDLINVAAARSARFASQVRQAGLGGLADLPFGQLPAIEAARHIVDLARFSEAHGGIGGSKACEPILVAALESIKAQVANHESLERAIAKLQAVPRNSDESPMPRSTRQAAIALRALSMAKPLGGGALYFESEAFEAIAEPLGAELRDPPTS